MSKSFVHALAAALLSMVTTVPAVAQWQQSQPISVVVGQGPGAANENAFRTIAKLSAENIDFLVVNRPGLDGGLSWNFLNDQPADGSHVMVNVLEGSLFVVPNAYPTMVKLDPNQAIPVSVIASAPFAFVVRSDSDIHTVPDLIKAYQGKFKKSFNVGISGSGNLLVHSLLQDFVQSRTADVAVIRYKAAPQAVAELIAGAADVVIVPSLNARAMAEAGKVRLIAITSEKPLKAAPNIPLMKDHVPGLVVGATWSVFLKPGTPDQVVDWYVSKLVPAIKNPMAKRTFEEQWAVTFDDAGPEHMKRLIQQTRTNLASVAKRTVENQETKK